tara:strand:+ start:234 stop:1145 length:912 start_codon:yes stop_codon:yes gene_type:complete
MGLTIGPIQNLLELHNLGYLKNFNSVCDIGSEELHIKKEDLKKLFEIAGLKTDLVEKYPDTYWPERPRTPAKFFYESLGLKEYQCIDINGDFGGIPHDLNKPFVDKSKFNKFDIVTDFGSCEHIFNIGEGYRTMHNLTKPGGYIFVKQAVMKGNGYFTVDESFFEGIAAANNYKIIYNSFLITIDEKTDNGSYHEFHIPRNRKLLGLLNFEKFSNRELGQELMIYAVFQKTNKEEFKIPYQGRLMNDIYNLPAGFNRVYLKDPLGYTYVPSSTLVVEDVPFKKLISALIDKIKKIVRIRMLKK